jgi:hypothetical protein
MKKLFLSILICGLIAVSCSKDQNTSGTSNISDTSDKRSYGYFNAKLKAGMLLPDIKSTFGEPDSDVGSGTHIYVYKLKDATEIRIGYTDHILYARHLDTSGQLLHTLI